MPDHEIVPDGELHTEWDQRRVSTDLVLPPQNNRPIDDSNVQRLAASIARLGQLQALVVVREGDQYRVVVGAHRLEACKRLGRKEVDVVVHDGKSAGELAEASLHENEVRKSESVTDQIDRIRSIMQERQCSFAEAGRVGMLSKSKVSKLGAIDERLSEEALAFADQHNIGMSIVYEVAKVTDDRDQQLAWLKEHAAGRMSREAIIAAAKPTSGTRKKVTVQLTIEGVTVKLSMPSSISYEQIDGVLTKLKKLFAEQKRMNHPVSLLPQLMTNGAKSNATQSHTNDKRLGSLAATS